MYIDKLILYFKITYIYISLPSGMLPIPMTEGAQFSAVDLTVFGFNNAMAICTFFFYLCYVFIITHPSRIKDDIKLSFKNQSMMPLN